MSKVYTGASMSLDGYIAGPNETGFEHLFQWYGRGDVEVATAQPERTLHMTEPSARQFQQNIDRTLNRGYIPTKTMITSADVARQAGRAAEHRAYPTGTHRPRPHEDAVADQAGCGGEGLAAFRRVDRYEG